MSFVLQPWLLYLMILCGWINREQRELANGHLLHRSNFLSDVQMHVCLLIIQGKSHGSLTAVDYTEHGFAGKLKALGRGIARIRVAGRNWQGLAFPQSQDPGSQDRCDVNKSLLVGSARSISAVGHGQNIREARWQVCGRARPCIVYLPGGGAK